MPQLNAETLEALVARLHSDDIEDSGNALVELGHYCGTGSPSDEAKADRIGPDYICALDDGRIVAWGADKSLAERIGREVIVIA